MGNGDGGGNVGEEGRFGGGGVVGVGLLASIFLSTSACACRNSAGVTSGMMLRILSISGV